MNRLAIIAILAALAAVFHVKAARPHEAADWIRLQGYKNAIGELCCGERDCTFLADDDVQTRPGGFYIISLKETVPYQEATPTPKEGGGKYWRCQWGGVRKCFFAPVGQS